MSAFAMKSPSLSAWSRRDRPLSFTYEVDQSSALTQGARCDVEIVAPSNPTWLENAVKKINQLAALPHVDPYGSEPLSIEDVEDALGFLAAVMGDETIQPWIGRLASGGVQLTWEKGDIEIEAVFDRARDEHVVLFTDGEREWEAKAGEAPRDFAALAPRLSSDRATGFVSA